MLTTMITGGTGFVGSHVVQQARLRGAALTLMSHRRPVPPAAAPEARVVRADLADPGSLGGACEGVDVLVHCASQIGGTPEDNENVNARGTEALVAEARRAGVSRIVYLSTASVYGRGSFRGALPEQLAPAPESPTSRSRLAAEDAVLAAGGIVLRPHLVYGRGDAWVVPGLVRFLRALRGAAAGWNTRISAISAPELATLLVGLALIPPGRLTASVYHAAHPRPVTAATLLDTVADCAQLPRAAGRLTLAEARERLARDAWAAHRLDMLATDHWFESAPVWADLGQRPGPGFEEEFAKIRTWYRDSILAP
ncbi:NAD-dependent epimerase/dehydratase family protein [Streptomyces subrutilus]|uniref:3-beta hydroxysteroid dehydrogenase n=2 Tax=Streptomyces subrutilus TaxID=36818 RepID=A0A918QUX2_9ACTN|nr:NAD-dependent epimerase/dehydratase family protein [Streptomyces subrutilus]WSJ30956.1 NAD-dependent epimerase/dehydratase family protein [Streptomyces subrutilus]GGZ68361.1 3-beta hydroxysteroid dehydrogenase [Streptomyces subrutilus]